MAFKNFPSPTPIFPALPPQTWSVNKEPKFNTLTDVAISGREYQIMRQVIPRWEFTLRYGGQAWVRDQTQNIIPYGPLAGHTELEQLAGLFLACLGSAGEFYFNDPEDNSRFNSPVGTGPANGSQTTWPIFVKWGTGPFVSNPAFFPVQGVNTLQAVYYNGVQQLPLTNFNLDSSRTILVTGTPPVAGTVITADFSFYFRCRFNEDVEEFEQWAVNLWEKKQLKFTSVKP